MAPGTSDILARALRGDASWHEVLRALDARTRERCQRAVQNVEAAPREGAVLARLGAILNAAGRPELAAPVLARAVELEPTEGIVAEHIASLELLGRPSEAAAALQVHPDLLDRSFLCRYLLAFNLCLAGDIDGARALLPTLNEVDPVSTFMADRVRGIVARCDVLRGVTALDDTDLRGWMMALTGGLLLRTSVPGRRDSGPYGRFGVTIDHDAFALEGLQKVAWLLEVMEVEVPRIFAMPNFTSAVLGNALARILSRPVLLWPEGGTDAPGLVCAYDLEGLDPDQRRSLIPRQRGQILWIHAQRWIDEQPVVGDLVTFLYADNQPAWQASDGLRSREVADRVIQSTLVDDALDGLPALVELTRAAARAGRFGPSLLRRDGQREKLWAGSPVPRTLER